MGSHRVIVGLGGNVDLVGVVPQSLQDPFKYDYAHKNMIYYLFIYLFINRGVRPAYPLCP